ncbi:MAG: hypothetical protein AAGA48_36695 [Myxococcota bacterium]
MDAAPPAGPLPKPDVGQQLDQAGAIVDRFPEHPVADHAWLYVLDGLSRHPDDPLVVDATLNILSSTTDPLVQTHAARLLGNLDYRTIPLDDLDRVAAAIPLVDKPTERYNLARLGLSVTLDQRAFDAAPKWADRLASTVEEICGGDWPVALCEAARQIRDSSSSWLTAHHSVRATSWTAATGALAHRCHLDGEVLSASLTGEGAWDGKAWSWSRWKGPRSMRRCIASKTAFEPLPPVGARITLSVLPAR